MMSQRKPSRRPTASRYKRGTRNMPKSVSSTGNGQGGFVGPSVSAAGLW
jgi:hypothetical protein